jgi:Acetyltransferase (GNAT) domain
MIEVVPFAEVPPGEWDGVVVARGGTIYQTWAWVSLLSRSYRRMQNISLAVREGDSITGVFPLLVLKLSGFRYGVSLPGSSGGPLVREADLAPLVDRGLGSCDVLELHSYQKLPLPRPVVVPHLYVPLSPEVEKVRGRFKKNVRTAVRKARLSGVTVRSSRGEKDVEAFCEVYEKTVLTQSGPSRLSKAHVGNVVGSLPPDRCRFLVAEKDGRVVGGLVGLFHGKDAYYWAAASERGTNASEALLNELVDYSAKNHSRLILGGGRYGARDSLYFFKSRWGSLPLEAYRYSLVSGAKGAAVRSLSRLANRFPWLRGVLFQ